MRTHTASLAGGAALLCAAALVPLPAGAQEGVGPDTVEVVPGAEYAAGGVYRFLMGSSYRDLWTRPVRVPVLDPGRFAGGLTPVRRGGGRQTQSLRLRGADGREYAFRSVKKDLPFLPPELRRAFAGQVVLDQLKSQHPAGALVLPPLLRAVGVPHTEPVMVVMAGHPALGEHRREFAGMLGLLEERPDEGADGEPGFAGARRVVSTDRMLEHLEEDPTTPVDARAFLRARMVDLLVGDWDRHADQWRWALVGDGGAARWLPVPRDRDQAFARFDGALVGLAREQWPRAALFDRRFRNLYGLAYNGRELDHRLLGGLERAAWDSVVAGVQTALSDEVVAAAVARLPAAYADEAPPLARMLRGRRGDLPRAAAWLYRFHAGEPDVHGSDLPETVDVERLADGRVHVRVTPHGVAAPGFSRVFHPGETREIRIYPRGGDDRVTVTGEARRSILVRVVGGGGDDHFADASRVGGRGERTRFYDHRGDNRIRAGRETHVDLRPFTPPPPNAPFVGDAYRDWGGWGHTVPVVGFQPEVGPVVGAGRVWYRNGFRAVPHASRTTLRVAAAPTTTRFGVEAERVVRLPNSGVALSLTGRATQLEVTRFFGFGNDVAAPRDEDFYTVRQWQAELRPSVVLPLGRAVSLSTGPIVRYADADADEASLLNDLRPYGAGAFGQAGWRAGVEVSPLRPAADSAPRRPFALRLAAGGAVYPAVWDVESTYGRAEAVVTSRLRAGLPLRPTLAVRAGAARTWGDTPFHDAAVVGGPATLRGFAERRFAGDAALHGSAELRLALFRSPYVIPGVVGVMGVADAGRVYLDGRSPGGWHTAAGGGAWLQLLGQGPALTVVAMSGERTRLYAGISTEF